MSEMHTVNEHKKDTKTYFYVALICAVLGAVASPLCLTPLGVYALIAGMLLELCSLAFSEKQKKVNPIKQLRWVNILAYVVLGLTTLVFVGGIIFVYVTTGGASN